MSTAPCDLNARILDLEDSLAQANTQADYLEAKVERLVNENGKLTEQVEYYATASGAVMGRAQLLDARVVRLTDALLDVLADIRRMED
jgi:chromosome segregation ATPase